MAWISASVGKLALLVAGAAALGSPAYADPAPGTRHAAAEPCAAGGGRLPLTGLCATRAVNYLNTPGVTGEGGPPEAPEGCEWVVQETKFGSGVLLYLAAKCGRKTTRLAYADGALSYETSAQGTAKGTLVAKVAGPDDMLKVAQAAITDPAEKAKCKLRKAGIDGWPEDAQVVDTMTLEEDRAAPQDDGPRAACGEYGFNGDEASYWRVFQGHGWFFQLGQDALEIDPGSFTLMTKSSDGSWTQAE